MMTDFIRDCGRACRIFIITVAHFDAAARRDSQKGSYHSGVMCRVYCKKPLA
jgi:hypothetical protein